MCPIIQARPPTSRHFLRPPQHPSPVSLNSNAGQSSGGRLSSGTLVLIVRGLDVCTCGDCGCTFLTYTLANLNTQTELTRMPSIIEFRFSSAPKTPSNPSGDDARDLQADCEVRTSEVIRMITYGMMIWKLEATCMFDCSS